LNTQYTLPHASINHLYSLVPIHVCYMLLYLLHVHRFWMQGEEHKITQIGHIPKSVTFGLTMMNSILTKVTNSRWKSK